ncbi:MAG: hypothetical protein JWP25_1238 [Bradyrhizobium sp.]|nr:hypothetical protein [Bradyrhizobium sp.]
MVPQAASLQAAASWVPVEIVGDDLRCMAPNVTRAARRNTPVNGLLRVAGFAICVFNLLQYAFAAREIGLARFGQDKLAGAALHQTNIEVRLDCRDVFTGH